MTKLLTLFLILSICACTEKSEPARQKESSSPVSQTSPVHTDSIMPDNDDMVFPETATDSLPFKDSVAASNDTATSEVREQITSFAFVGLMTNKYFLGS